MTIDIVPFILYLILFCFVISWIPFFKKSGISVWVLIGLFCIKVAVGVVYGMYLKTPAFVDKADTWRFYRESLPETQLLLHHPLLFIKSIFTHSYTETGGLFSGKNSYWNDLKDNIIIKLMAVCNVFTRNNYFTNVIFFNFSFLFGLVAFFKLVWFYSRTHKYCLLAAIFLMPSFLFWGSGIHKDGLLFSALGIVFYCFYHIIKKKGKAKHWISFTICFLLLFLVKNYLAIALVPALFSWWLADRNHQRHQFYFMAVYAGCLFALIVIALLGDHTNVMVHVVNKHNEFLLLNGNSAIKVPPLVATTESVIMYFPTAIDIAFVRPHLSEIKNASYALAFSETLLSASIIILFLVFGKHKRLMPPFYICCFYFVFSVLLLDGYTVTFTGAIVRYRSLMLPLLIAPMVAMIPFKNSRKQ